MPHDQPGLVQAPAALCSSTTGCCPTLQEDTDLGSAAKPRGRAPRCITLAPTRELAQQVQREFAEAAPSLAVGVFYGGAQLVQFPYTGALQLMYSVTAQSMGLPGTCQL